MSSKLVSQATRCSSERFLLLRMAIAGKGYIRHVSKSTRAITVVRTRLFEPPRDPEGFVVVCRESAWREMKLLKLLFLETAISINLHQAFGFAFFSQLHKMSHVSTAVGLEEC
jgi:hypothetical protein